MPHPQQPEDNNVVARGWFETCALPQVDAAIRAVHAELARETARREPTCVSSGRCCHFEDYGHRLYVTGIETAWTLSQLANQPHEVPLPTCEQVDAATTVGTCPFLSGALCSIHTIKPMACRLFFCDETATEWQADLYERFQTSIIEIHKQHDIPYRYGEWRSMLRQCAGAEMARTGPNSTDDASPPVDPHGFVQVRLP